jgi:uncharacterized protein YbjT (DUF2867 family)
LGSRKDNVRIAVTGSTGYIGGRLVPRLLAEGLDVVCLARNPGKLNGRSWSNEVEAVRADVFEPETLESALQGCDAAYYLVHSMGGPGSFQDADRVAAHNFAEAAAAAGVGRIIYLGGLGDEDDRLSAHLGSRHEVGRALASGPVPVTELRAAVIIGSGSVSFEMLRYLTEVLPAMVTPSWVQTKCQPIAIRDVLAYLLAALDDDLPGHTIYEIGGSEVLSYLEMMQAYARVAGLPRRFVVPVPVLTPRLSSLWIGLVTPLPVGVARPLVDSLKNEVIVRDDRAKQRFDIAPTPLDAAIERALEHSEDLSVDTRWSDATTGPARPFQGDPSWSGGTLFVDHKEVETAAEPKDVFRSFTRIGGDVGYHGFDWAWRLRGLIDIFVGGVGLRRGRRHPQDVRLEDTIDFWRVTRVEPGRRLQLSAEMRLPGDAWLEWSVDAAGDHSVLHQNAYFRPRGLTGRLYWYALLPFHHFIFGNMARRIAADAEAESTDRAAGPHSPDA